MVKGPEGKTYEWLEALGFHEPRAEELRGGLVAAYCSSQGAEGRR